LQFGFGRAAIKHPIPHLGGKLAGLLKVTDSSDGPSASATLSSKGYQQDRRDRNPYTCVTCGWSAKNFSSAKRGVPPSAK